MAVVGSTVGISMVVGGSVVAVDSVVCNKVVTSSVLTAVKWQTHQLVGLLAHQF